MRLERRGGRKLIVTPEGATVPQRKPACDETLIKALVHAHSWWRWLESGRVKSPRTVPGCELLHTRYCQTPGYCSKFLRQSRCGSCNTDPVSVWPPTSPPSVGNWRAERLEHLACWIAIGSRRSGSVPMRSGRARVVQRMRR